MSTGQPLQPEDALRYLINAVNIGQSRGVWKLNEAATLQQAVEAVQPFFTVRQIQTPQVSLQNTQPFNPSATQVPVEEDTTQLN